jgi:DNA primase
MVKEELAVVQRGSGKRHFPLLRLRSKRQRPGIRRPHGRVESEKRCRCAQNRPRSPRAIRNAAKAQPAKRVKKEDAQLKHPAYRDGARDARLDFELKTLDYAHPYLPRRGFTDETIQKFGLGYCSKGYLVGRIAIPLHDELGP